MADIDILSMPQAPGLGGGEAVPIVQGGVNKRTTLQAIADLAVVPSAVTWKQQCQAATVGVLPSNTYANGSSGVGATLTATSVGVLTIDDYTPILNDRVLIKNEVLPATNGIYSLSQVGDGSTPWILTRTIDFDAPDNIAPGDATSILTGTQNGGTFWFETLVVSSVGSSAISFSELFLTYADGDGILINGNVISIDPSVVATLTDPQTLTNKTLITPIITGFSGNAAVQTDGSGNFTTIANTGTGSNVLANSPTLVTPNLGTPSAINLANATGLPPSALPLGGTDLPLVGNGASVPTYRQLPLASGVTGSLPLANLTFGTSGLALVGNGASAPAYQRLPISTGVGGLGVGVSTFLATPSSANLAAALLDETGAAGGGLAVFSNNPAIVLGSAATGLGSLATGAGILPQANGGAVTFATKALAQAYTPIVAPPYIQLNGYFSAGDLGGALYSYFGTSAPAHAGYLMITLADGVTLAFYQIAEQELLDRMFGVKCDGNWDGTGTDNHVALQNWASCPIGGIKRHTGCAFSSVGIGFLAGCHVEGYGATTGIDMTGVTSMPGNFSVAYVDQVAFLTAMPGLAADITTRNAIPVTDNSGWNPADYGYIYNPTDFSLLNYRSTYRAGEGFRVGRLGTGNIISPMDPLYSLYTAAAVDIYKMGGPQVIFRNARYKPPYLTARGLFIDCSAHPIVENIIGTGSRYSNIDLQRCFDEYVNCDLFELEDTISVGNEYGLTHSSCCGGEVHGDYYSQRHGIANGNDDAICCVPNQAIRFYASTHSYGFDSLDIGHGCNRGHQVIGGVHDGIAIGGFSPKVTSPTLRVADGVGFQTTGALSLLNGSEFGGGLFDFSGMTGDTWSDSVDASSAPIDLVLLSGITEPITFRFSHPKIGNYAANSFFWHIQMQGNTQPASLIITDPLVDDPTAAITVGLVRVTYSSGTTVFDKLVVTGVKGLGATVQCLQNAGGFTANTWDFDSQHGSITVAGNTGVQQLSGNITYPWAYPTNAIPNGRVTAGSANLGGSQVIVRETGATVSAVGYQVQTPTGTNFASTANGTLNWDVFFH